jgi:DNA-binding GntR family transcriptional regulator
MREHLDIIATLEARNPERAARALTTHILNAQNRAMAF